MSLRERMNQNKNISVGLTAGIIVLAIIFIWYQLKGDSIPTPEPQMAYYTTDDGKTFFAEDQMKEVPFTKDGAEAVRAWMYVCGDSKDKKLAYLERYTAAFRKQLAQSNASKQPIDPAIIIEQGDSIYEVKKPGTPNWVPKISAPGQRLILPNCPAGKNPTWVNPAQGTKPGEKVS